MSSTVTTTLLATSATAVPLDSPPIANILPLIANTLPIAFSALASLARGLSYVTYTLLYPILVILSPLLAVFAPILFSAQLLLSVFVTIPYNIISSVLTAVYPIYVFCGVACVLGGLLGLAGRLLVPRLSELLVGGTSESFSNTPVSSSPSSKQLKTSKGKRKDVLFG